jgi:hypothetical protein
MGSVFLLTILESTAKADFLCPFVVWSFYESMSFINNPDILIEKKVRFLGSLPFCSLRILDTAK